VTAPADAGQALEREAEGLDRDHDGLGCEDG
jgi:hypothetical protein